MKKLNSRYYTVNKFLLITFLFLGSSLQASEYYISKNGSDSSPGTIDQPWNTIGMANSSLSAGDTVFIRAGEYREVIKPTRSGSKDSFITYSGYLNENPVITDSPGNTAIVLTSRSYIKIQNLKVDGKNLRPNANLDDWIIIDNGHYNVIQDCTLQYATDDGITLTNATHNQIINNTMDGAGHFDVDTVGIGEIISFRNSSNHNLFKNNTTARGGHNILLVVDSSFNAIVSNTFDNQWTTTGGYRSVVLKGSNVAYGWNLFEDNILTGTLEAADGNATAAMDVEGKGQIIRRNFFFNNAEHAISGSARIGKTVIVDNYIYNNTFYDNGGPELEWREYASTTELISGNVFKNNIGFKNRQDPMNANLDTNIHLALNSNMGGNTYISNNLMKANPGDANVRIKFASKVSLSDAQTAYPSNFSKNIQKDPGFVSQNPSKRNDFQLLADSNCIDAGDFLTTTTSASSGTLISVDAAGYFTDGFGVMAGDLVQVGSNAPVQIKKVDYSRNLITVNKDISWNKGDGVSLPYSGSAPDIGAIEHNDLAIMSPPLPPQMFETR